MPVTRFKLAQTTSEFGVPGQFVSSDGSDERETLIIVPVRVQAVRTLWPEGGFQRGRGPSCHSSDGAYADEFLPTGERTWGNGRLCAECPFYASQPWKLEQGTRFCAPATMSSACPWRPLR
jgi:hypothetical protein